MREFVNQGLRRLGFKRPYSVADINDILTRSERYLKTGRTPGTIGMDQWKAERDGGGPQYSLEDEFKPDEVAVIKHGGFGLQKRSKTYRQRFDEIRNNTKTRFRQYWIDQYDSINSIIDNPRAWMKAQLAASSWGSVEAGVEHGRLALHKEGVVTVDTDQKGLKELLAPLGADIDRFMYWIAGNRAEKLMGEGRENLFNLAQIQVLKNILRS